MKTFTLAEVQERIIERIRAEFVAGVLTKGRKVDIGGGCFTCGSDYEDGFLLDDVHEILNEMRTKNLVDSCVHEQFENIKNIAKWEEIERCDPNGTWYDVAQAYEKKIDQLEKELDDFHARWLRREADHIDDVNEVRKEYEGRI